MGHWLLIFMDLYSGYNHIPMYGLDEEHAIFVIDQRLCCYKFWTEELHTKASEKFSSNR